MQKRTLVFVSLFWLGVAHPVCASASPLPALPPPSVESKPMIEGRQPPVMPSTPFRGQLLYENHCTVCHESAVHIRNGKRANSLPELRTWVMKWSSYLKLRWGTEEVEDVARHLDNRYYKFGNR